ncbi:MAG: YbaB/EbfC family nucleoid-associated protein [Bdellovibrionales bacterium]|nr:YbaB/EbfC family nucleoid-associated protein [Bdellovibrionales bacterium]
MKGGMAGLIKQMNQMQTKISKIKEELDTTEYESSAGGGAVQVTVTGAGQISRLDISKDLLDDGDLEMLQDLVKTAVNEALKTSQTERDKAMEKVTGGISLPGLGF